MSDDFFEENSLLLDAEDVEVLMHRNAHFGGSFALMLEYYQTQNKGALLDEERIEYLQRVEDGLEEDLAPYLLKEADEELVAQAQEAYRQLRALYQGAAKGPTALADLILAEESEEEDAIEAIKKEGNRWIEELIQLLEAQNFALTLFPGYGYAPALAAKLLGEIGDERALMPLLGAVGHENEAIDLAAIEALVQFKDAGKKFLIQALASNGEKAAAALSAFPEDEEIGKCAFEMLKDPQVRKSTLATYLAICCSGLKSEKDLEQMAAQNDLSKEAKEELLHLVKARRARSSATEKID